MPIESETRSGEELRLLAYDLLGQRCLFFACALSTIPASSSMFGAFHYKQGELACQQPESPFDGAIRLHWLVSRSNASYIFAPGVWRADKNNFLCFHNGSCCEAGLRVSSRRAIARLDSDLNRKRTAAATATGGVWIAEGKARAHDRADVVYLYAIQILPREHIYENPKTLVIEYVITGTRPVLDLHRVRKSAAAARYHSNSQSGLSAWIFGFDEFLYFRDSSFSQCKHSRSPSSISRLRLEFASYRHAFEFRTLTLYGYLFAISTGVYTAKRSPRLSLISRIGSPPPFR